MLLWLFSDGVQYVLIAPKQYLFVLRINYPRGKAALRCGSRVLALIISTPMYAQYSFNTATECLGEFAITTSRTKWAQQFSTITIANVGLQVPKI